MTVVAIHRHEEVEASPGPETRFEPGDIVYLFGKTDKLYAVKPLFSGPLKENATAAKSTPATA